MSLANSPENRRFKLQAVLFVMHPLALGFDPFPGAYRWNRADYRDQVLVSLSFDPQHGKAGLLIVKGDSLN